MSSRTLLYWGFLTAVCASIAWAILSGDSIVRPEPEAYRDIFFLVPWTLTALTIYWLHTAQRSRTGLLGKVGFWTTVAAMVVGAVAITGATLGADRFLAVALLSVLVWIAGMAGYGIATIRAGVALMLSEPLTIALGLALSPWIELADTGSYSGAIGNGLAILVVGMEMRQASLANPERQANGRLIVDAQPADSETSSVFS